MFHIEVHWKESFQSNTELGFIQQSLRHAKQSIIESRCIRSPERSEKESRGDTDWWMKKGSIRSFIMWIFWFISSLMLLKHQQLQSNNGVSAHSPLYRSKSDICPPSSESNSNIYQQLCHWRYIIYVWSITTIMVLVLYPNSLIYSHCVSAR